MLIDSKLEILSLNTSKRTSKTQKMGFQEMEFAIL